MYSISLVYIEKGIDYKRSGVLSVITVIKDLNMHDNSYFTISVNELIIQD